MGRRRRRRVESRVDSSWQTSRLRAEEGS
jgi:hypothetical protein